MNGNNNSGVAITTTSSSSDEATVHVVDQTVLRRRSSSFRHRNAIQDAANTTTPSSTVPSPTPLDCGLPTTSITTTATTTTEQLEPVRGPPPVYTLPQLYYPNSDPGTQDTCSSTTRPEDVVPSLWLQKSPFAPYRSHSVVMTPADRPWIGDPASVSEESERRTLAAEEAERGRLPGRFVTKEELADTVENIEASTSSVENGDDEEEDKAAMPITNSETTTIMSKRRLYIPDRFPRSAINNDPTHLVVPNSLDPLPCHLGHRMRISRKNSKNVSAYRHLYFVLPDLSVRFSALMAILKASGLEELRASNIVAMMDAHGGGRPKLKRGKVPRGKKSSSAADPPPPSLKPAAASKGPITTTTTTTVGTSSSSPRPFSLQQRYSSLFRAGMSWSEKLDALHSFACGKVLDSSMWSLRWCKRMHSSDYGAMRPYQRVNHFPATWGIGRKDNLHKRLKKFADSFGDEQVYFFPAAFILPQDSATLKRDMQQRRFPPAGQRNNIYIVKQVASACGRGMHLLKGKANPNRVRLPEGQWLVQRYIHDPFLIDGYKFDLRIYVLVTSFNPLRVYLYEDGLVRFATTPYPTNDDGGDGDNNGASRSSGEDSCGGGSSQDDNSDAADVTRPNRGGNTNTKTPSKKKKSKVSDFKLKDISAHLTNYSVNKHTSNFVQPDAASATEGGGVSTPTSTGADEPDDDDDDDDTPDDEKGSKWVISTLKRYLEQKRGIPFAPIWRAVVDVILKTLISVEGDVNSQMRLLFSGGGGTTGGKAPSSSATAVGEDGRPLPHASLVHRPGTAINNCFELYGFDILLRDKPMMPVPAATPTDSGVPPPPPPAYDPKSIPQLTPVLMEVNIMPSLHTRASTLDQRIKGNMMANMLNIVGVYASKKKYKNGVPAPCPAPAAYKGPTIPIPRPVSEAAITATDGTGNIVDPPPAVSGAIASVATSTASSVPTTRLTAGLRTLTNTTANPASSQPPQQLQTSNSFHQRPGSRRSSLTQLGGGTGTALSGSQSIVAADVTPLLPIWERHQSLLPNESSQGGFPFTSTAQDQTGGAPPSTTSSRAARGAIAHVGPPGAPLRPPTSVRSNSNAVGRRVIPSAPSSSTLRPSNSQPRFSSVTGSSSSSSALPPPPQRTRSANNMRTGSAAPGTRGATPGGGQGRNPSLQSPTSLPPQQQPLRPTNAANTTKPMPTVAGTLYDFHPFFRTLTPVEMDVVCQAEEELDRRGSFTRIFPPMPVPPTSLLYDKAALSTTTTHKDTATPPPPPSSVAGPSGTGINNHNTVLMSSQGWEGYKRFYVEPRPYNEILHTWEYVKQIDPPSWYSTNSNSTLPSTEDPKGRDNNNTKIIVEDGDGEEDDEDGSDTIPDDE